MIARPSLGELLRALVARGEAPPDAPARAAEAITAAGEDTPWFVRLVVGAAAWGSSFFFGAFLDLIGWVDIEDQGLPFGLLFAAAAILLRRQWSTHEQASGQRAPGGLWADFGVQAALALSLMARFYVLIGMNQFVDRQQDAVLALIPLELLFLALYNDPVQRFLASALLGLWSGIAVFDRDLPLLREAVALAFVAATGLLWARLADVLRSPLAAWATPVGYGLAIAASGLLLEGLIFAEFREDPPYGWPLTLGVILLVAALAWRILRDLEIDPRSKPALVAWALLALLAAIGWREAGVPAALGLLALAFRARERWLLVLGVLFTLAFGTHFYYDMDLDLLLKSGVLVGSGLAMLAARWALLHGTDDEVSP